MYLGRAETGHVGLDVVSFKRNIERKYTFFFFFLKKERKGRGPAYRLFLTLDFSTYANAA